MSDLVEFLFLVRRDFVYFRNELVGDLLHLFLCILEIVLGHLGGFLLRFELLHRLTAYIANGDFALLTVLADLLCEFLTSLLGELREHQADHSAVVLRIYTEV